MTNTIRRRGKLLLRTEGVCDIDPAHLLEVFGEQRQRLVAVLRGFSPGDWAAPTRCADWSAHDVVRHLCDCNAVGNAIVAGTDDRTLDITAGLDPRISHWCSNRVFARSVYRFTCDGSAISSYPATKSSTSPGTSSGASRTSRATARSPAGARTRPSCALREAGRGACAGSTTMVRVPASLTAPPRAAGIGT